MAQLNNKDMIIRLWIYGTLTVLTLFFMGHDYIENKINISKAEGCYKSKNYICAFKAYRNAFATGMENSQYVGHYVSVLAQLKKITVVQEELNNLLTDYPDNPNVAEIESIFEKIKEETQKKYPDTYISDVVQGVNVIHWNTKERNTLNVFIDESNSSKFPGYYIQEVKKAFGDYSTALNNLIKFEYINDSSKSDINVIFTKQISGGQCSGSGCSNVMGLTENTTVGSLLSKSVISLRYRDSDNTDFTKNQIYNIAKHEIGHALGVSGHSYNSADIMYPISNDAKWAEDSYMLKISRKEFSQRDIDTFMLLYNIVPDITDKKYDVTKYPDMYFPVAAIGTKKYIAEKNLEESQRYINMVDTNYISQMNLAESYFASKDLDKAQEAFQNALTLAVSDDEKFSVYNNLAVVLYEKEDYSAAIDYADMANSYSKEEQANEIKTYCLMELKKYKEAQKMLEDLVEKNPDNSTYSAALVNVYFKQYKTISAFKELKRIKKSNPSIVQEQLFKPYSMMLKFL